MPDRPMQEPRRTWRRPFQFDIATVFCLLIAGTVSVVAAYSYRANSRAALEVAADLVTQVTRTVIDKTAYHLAPAETVSETVGFLVRPRMDELTRSPEIESYLVKGVSAYPQLCMVYVGDEDGNFIQATRQPDDSITTQIIRREQGVATAVVHRRDAAGAVIGEKIRTDETYDPRAREWYREAKAKQARCWSDVYVFFTGSVPGLTASYPVHAETGGFRGVVGADIALAELSAFLRGLRIGKSGFVFIYDGAGQVVVHPDLRQMTRGEGKDVRRLAVGEMQDPRIAGALAEHRRQGSSRFAFDSDGVRQLAYFTPFPSYFGKDWTVVVIVPEDDFVGPVKATQRATLLITAGFLLIAILLALPLARSLSRPIEKLTAEALRIRDLHLDGEIGVHSHVREIDDMAQAMASMKTGLQAFRKYVPAALVRQLITTGEEARLGGVDREMTVLFSDIADFTPLSENLPPRELMLHLSDYLGEMSRIISEEGGTVDKYIGDSVMAFWNAPQEDSLHGVRACRAALRCRRRLEELDARWRAEGKPPMPTRFGIHTGHVVVGNVGSAERMNYSVVGDGVNLASRIEGANKFYGTRLLVTHGTFVHARNDFVFRPIDYIAPRGKTVIVRIYEILCMQDDPDADRLAAMAELFREGVELYQNRKWHAARMKFEAVQANFPDDRPAAIYIERCLEYASRAPGPDWNGTVRLTQK